MSLNELLDNPKLKTVEKIKGIKERVPDFIERPTYSAKSMLDNIRIFAEHENIQRSWKKYKMWASPSLFLRFFEREQYRNSDK